MKEIGDGVLLVGSRGYVGSALREALNLRGVEFSTLDRASPDEPYIYVLKGPNQIIRGDIRDTENFSVISQFNIIYLLAADTSKHSDPESVAKLVGANVLLPALLASYLTDSYSLMVFTSTYSYRSEANSFFPQTAYAASKFAGERMIEFFATRSKLTAIALHVYDIYGPRQPHDRLIPSTVAKIRSGEVISLSPGEQEFRPVFIDDLIDVLLLLSSEARTGGGFRRNDIFGPDTLRVNEVPKKLADTLGLSLGQGQVRHVLEYREREIMKFDNCHSLPIEKSEWTPLEKGIRLAFSDSGKNVDFGPSD